MSLSDLDAARRRALHRLFAEALALPEQERAAFVERTCGHDELLQRELTALLDALDVSEAYFDELAQHVVAPMLDADAESDADAIGDVGSQLAHYEILAPVGGGGMGIVYKARDVRLGRTVALKFLPARLAGDDAARAQLLAEAQAASALDHPNIAVVYDVGATESGLPYIAMAWYDGETLAERLRRGALPVREAVDVARQLAGALAAAHAAGIIHRDVKPANVVITRAGVAKLLDFGIARHVSTAAGEERATPGTLAYMSPEQTRGAALDARSDVWSLGVMLYEMLAGRRPFSGGSHAALLDAIHHSEPPPLAAVRPELPPALGDVVHRCLAKDATRRFQTAHDVVSALAVGSRTDAPPSIVARRHRRTRVAAATIAACVIALVAYAGMVFMRTTRSASVASAAAAEAASLRSIAVLPFVSADGDATDTHLSLAFSGELGSALARTPGLTVPARSSAAILRARDEPPRDIGQRLGVAAVLAGTVRRSGNALAVEARLVRVSDGSLLWSARYDREMGDVFAIQREIVAATLSALDADPVARARARRVTPPTNDVGAYELYLKGRFAWLERTGSKLEEALAYYAAALERDPSFALAYSATAEAYLNMSNFNHMPVRLALARASVAAERAIALDSTLAEAFAARGFVLASRGAYAESEAAFLRAIEIDPNYAWAHHYYALLLAMVGRVNDAVAQTSLALELDPLSLPANSTRGVLLLMQGQSHQAREQLRHTVSLAPNFPLCLYYLGVTDASEGRYGEARQSLEGALASAPGFPGVRAALAHSFARLGRDADAAAMLAALRAEVVDERSRVNLALGLAVVGAHDEAFRMLDRVEWDVPTLIELRANPLLAAFRADARYASLLARSGLEP